MDCLTGDWLRGRERAGDSGDIRSLIYGWNCGDAGFRMLRVLESRGGQKFMWERQCSRQIEKENRRGQARTQKLLELKVRQIDGVVELRASCSCIAGQRSTGRTLTGSFFRMAWLAWLRTESQRMPRHQQHEVRIAQHNPESPPHLRSQACNTPQAVRLLAVTVPIVT
jgi:hypothetical protein